MADGRVSGLLEALVTPTARATDLSELARNPAFNSPNLKILLDSTGFPNTAQMYFTAISTHAGDMELCARLVFIVRECDWMPLYYHVIPGNVLDKNTIEKCLSEAEKLGLTISGMLFDAGYMTAENMDLLKEGKIDFMTRMDSNLTEYRELLEDLYPTLDREGNAVEYNGRLVFIACRKKRYRGRRCFCYVCLDTAKRAMEDMRVSKRDNTGKGISEIFREHSRSGIFVLASTKKLGRAQVLPSYYARQEIEQIFDLAKNEANVLPIRTHSEEAMQGHVLVAFLATMASRWLQSKLSGKPQPHSGRGRKPKEKRHIGLRECLKYFRNVRISVYPDGTGIVSEPQKVVNEVLGRLGLEMPKEVGKPAA